MLGSVCSKVCVCTECIESSVAWTHPDSTAWEIE